MHPRLLGTTFSQLQCRYLGLDYKETFKETQRLGFDFVRLCTYWNEIEGKRGEFDFSAIDWLLDAAQDFDLPVILCVGMKTPRWPEFHFPEWIAEKYKVLRTDLPLDRLPGLGDEAMVYTHRVVEHTRDCPNIVYWQVENEALNHAPVAAGRYLSSDFISSEIRLVREVIAPHQKIIFTFGADPPFGIQNAKRMLSPLLPQVDAIGFDVYTKVGMSYKIIKYVETLPFFWLNLRRWKDFVMTTGKEAWIAESQAEPWEPNKIVAIEKQRYPSSNPVQAIKLASRLVSLGFERILLWGCEHWYWHKKQGNREWWDAVLKYVKHASMQ